MFGAGNTLQFSTCLFYVLLMLSFALSVSNVADEDKKEKAFPVSVLVINSLVMFCILLQLFGVKMMGELVQKNSLLIFFIVLILSFVLSIENVSDNQQENKSLPTIALIVNSIVLLMVAFNFAMRFMK